MSGEMTTLSEYITVQGGYAYKSESFQKEGEYPVLKIKNVRFGHVSYNETSFISSEIAELTKSWCTKEGDILISMTGSGPNAPESLVGRVARVWKNEPKAFINQRVGRIKMKFQNSIYSDYIFYLLSEKSSQEYLVNNSSGSANQANISSKTIESLPCPKIDFETSQRIGQTLRQLDEKILLNRQINQTLEAMAQALFKSWFVDFEPVRAKIAALETGEDPTQAAMRTISGKTDDELAHWQNTDPDAYAQLHTTASLFPDALTESELGLVPEGWEVKPFGDTITLIGGGTPKRTNAEFWDGDIPWFSIKDIPDAADIFVIDTEEKITSQGLDGSSTRLLKKGTVIITARGTVGKIAVVGNPMAMNQSCYGVVNKDYFAPILTYYRVKQAVSILQRNTHGAVFDTITKDTFNTFYSVVPPENIADAFQHGVFPIFYQVDSNVRENRTLANLRDTLLPKLLSGELTVGEAIVAD